MKWQEYQQLAGKLIECEDHTRKSHRWLGVCAGMMAMSHIRNPLPEFHKIMQLTSIDIRDGLDNSQWIKVSTEIRELIKKGILK